MRKDYTGTCFIGVVGSEIEIGECRDSIERMLQRPGDSGPNFVRATKGYEARSLHLNNFIRSKHDFLLLLDADQVIPRDTLERLRSHKLPYVTGYYLRRQYAPMLPVWYELGPRGRWPMTPMVAEPERGKLIPLGASGWGCVLVHRDVIEAVQKLLKGEDPILEDDLDIWPYDLATIMGALHGLEDLASGKVTQENLLIGLRAHLATLREEIRPLRVLKSPVGSDLRFPFFAREAGYTLMGDPDVRVGHMLNYPLVPDDYAGTSDETRKVLHQQARTATLKEARTIGNLRKGLGAR